MIKNLIGIRLIVENFNQDLVQEISDLLDEIRNKHFSDSLISYRDVRNYLKSEGTADIVFHWSSDQKIMIEDLMNKIPVTWHVIKRSICVENQWKRQVEEAIWDKLNHSNEVCLISEISWTNVFYVDPSFKSE